MAVTLTFHQFSEKKPKHGEVIMYLTKVTSFDSYGYDLRSDTVEQCWFEYDEDGHFSGVQMDYDEGDSEPESEEGYHWKLETMIDGYIADDDRNNFLWMSVDDYFDSLPES